MSGSKTKRVMTFQEMRKKINEPVPEPPPPIDLDGIKETARLEGHQQAQDEIKAAREAQLAAEASAQALVSEIETAKSAWIQEVRTHLGRAMISAIENLVSIPEAQAAIMEKNFSEAVAQLAENQPVTVYVQPQDLEFAERLTSENVCFTVKPDPNLSGGVRFSGEQGEWDASIDIAVNSLIEAISHWLQDAEADRL
jgi:flagellar biosynthesis/type III secretory pathway protein FliH